jgi:hypothetical protein
MTNNRIDELLAEALATGTLPADATLAERAEVERMVETGAVLRAARIAIDAEASATMPTARARFERHVAAARAASLPALASVKAEPVRQRGFFGGILALNRGFTTTMSAAAIGLIAVLAVFLSQNGFRGVETASAQVLTPGDYVQVEGVVSESRDGRVSVHSEFGDFDFAVSADTSIVSGEVSGDVSSVRPGVAVLIGGLVGKDRVVAANTVAVAAATKAEPRKLKLVQLTELRPNLVGKVTLLTISPDGTKGRVHIDTGDGQRFVVPVDGQSAEELIQRFSTALGARVEVGAVVGSNPGSFRLQLQDAVPPTPAQTLPQATPDSSRPTRPDATATNTPQRESSTEPASPRFVDARGVILGRTGNALHIQTPRGPIVAELRRTSRILPGQSGLTIDAILKGDTAVGHEITITGGLDAATGHVIIDVAVLGPKRPARP